MRTSSSPSHSALTPLLDDVVASASRAAPPKGPSTNRLEACVKTRLTLAVAALAAFGAVLGFATTAYAHPTQTVACTGCHGTASVIKLAAVQTANDGTNATYQITITGGSGSEGYAVLSGSTNVAHASASSGSVTVPDGKTYTVWGVDVKDGAKSVSISPVAPPTPVPTPTPAPTPTPTPTSTPTPDPTPTPTPTPTPAGVCRLALHVASGSHSLPRVTVTLVNVTTDAKFVARTNAKGNVTFAALPYGTYKVRVTGRSGVSSVRTIIVGRTSAKLSMKVRLSRHGD
jgi:hypothetical protein